MKDTSRRPLVLCSLLLVGSLGLTAGTNATRDPRPASDCNYFDDWKDDIPGGADKHYHAGIDGGYSAVYSKFGAPTGTYLQEGSQTGDDYHSFAEKEYTAVAGHNFCGGDSTYYPYFEG